MTKTKETRGIKKKNIVNELILDYMNEYNERDKKRREERKKTKLNQG